MNYDKLLPNLSELLRVRRSGKYVALSNLKIIIYKSKKK